jgi:hypothetical protein
MLASRCVLLIVVTGDVHCFYLIQGAVTAGQQQQQRAVQSQSAWTECCSAVPAVTLKAVTAVIVTVSVL